MPKNIKIKFSKVNPQNTEKKCTEKRFKSFAVGSYQLISIKNQKMTKKMIQLRK